MPKIVLVADHNSPTLISLAEHLLDSDHRVYTARSPEMALEFARLYQPDVALVVVSFVNALGRPLPDLIAQVSPMTKVIVVADPKNPAEESGSKT